MPGPRTADAATDRGGLDAHDRRHRPLRVIGVVCLLALGSCGRDDARTVIPDSGAAASSPTDTVSSADDTGGGTGEGDAVADTASTAVTTTVATQPTSSITAPEAAENDEPADPVNLYALAGARAIAERANENGLDELDDDGVAEALLEAGEAAYEIEYPTVVTYLDVTQDEDGNLVVVTEDESQTEVGTAYVCVVAGKANASERACSNARG